MTSNDPVMELLERAWDRPLQRLVWIHDGKLVYTKVMWRGDLTGTQSGSRQGGTCYVDGREVEWREFK